MDVFLFILLAVVFWENTFDCIKLPFKSHIHLCLEILNLPNNSPHLRKSGSRSVVFDVGTNELGNSAEEDFLHSTVSNVMKGVGSPLPSVAIMPYPVLPWRFKALPSNICTRSESIRGQSRLFRILAFFIHEINCTMYANIEAEF